MCIESVAASWPPLTMTFSRAEALQLRLKPIWKAARVAEYVESVADSRPLLTMMLSRAEALKHQNQTLPNFLTVKDDNDAERKKK